MSITWALDRPILAKYLKKTNKLVVGWDKGAVPFVPSATCNDESDLTITLTNTNNGHLTGFVLPTTLLTNSIALNKLARCNRPLLTKRPFFRCMCGCMCGCMCTCMRTCMCGCICIN